MARQVEVGAIMDPLQLLPPEGELVFEIHGGLSVVRQLVRAVRVLPQLLGTDPDPVVPLEPLLEPVVEPLVVAAGLDEELHLCLLELAGAEDEVPRRDLVAERLAQLRDPEGHALPRGLLHVQEVHVRSLGRLRPQVHDRGVLLDRPHEGLEHEVEEARLFPL